VHGGYGIYYDRITLEVMSLEKGFDGRALALNVTAGNVVTDSSGAPVYLNPDGTFAAGAPQLLSSPFSGFLFTGAGSTGIDVIDNHLRNPMVQQFNLGIQKQLGQNFVVTVDGVHNLGTRFIIGNPVGGGSALMANSIPPTHSPRPSTTPTTTRFHSSIHLSIRPICAANMDRLQTTNAIALFSPESRTCPTS
jgi:hypothetical protein